MMCLSLQGSAGYCLAQLLITLEVFFLKTTEVPFHLFSSLQDVLNNLGSSELDEDDLMLDLDLSDDQRHRHGTFVILHTKGRKY